MKAFGEFWHNYFNLSGVTSRADYWIVMLVNSVVYILILFLTFMMGPDISEPFSSIILAFVAGIYPVALIIPTLSITVRRLHDSNHSGLWMLLLFTGAGILVNFIFTLLDTNHVNNKWVGTQYPYYYYDPFH